VSLPRLLRGLSEAPTGFDDHQHLHGGVPIRRSGRSLPAEIREADLRGRGGGGFPLATKLDAAVRARGTPALVVNGTEGEPLSAKDHLLLTRLPHLVIDGAIALARAAGTDEIRVALDEHDLVGDDVLRWALAARPELRRGDIDADVVTMPSGYVSGQETAIVAWQNGGIAKPTMSPPRVTSGGIGRRPTLVANVETVAHAALIARHGARWYRQMGTGDQPGTTLVTLGGAVARPGVYEVEYGTSLRSLLQTSGGVLEEIDAFLIGGYAGTWVDGVTGLEVRICDTDLARVGARLGAGVIVAVPVSGCPVAETARVTRWMAAQSSGQCGPCIHGLAAMADTMDAIVAGSASPDALVDLERWCGLVRGRGACAHPDGVAMLVTSTLARFTADLLDHAHYGRCQGCERRSVLGVPELATRR
jgi:NADH:ubiquinone oxidoreductase subunit F (NADH-binding)